MAAQTSAAQLKKLRDRIIDIENEVVEKEAAVLAYGDKGTGKTTAIQALAQKLRGDGQIFRLDSSDGWVSLDNIPTLKKNTTGLQYATVEDLGIVAEAIAQRKPGFENITVLVLDEISTWYTDALHAYVREQKNLAPEDPLPPFGWDYYGPVQAALLEVLKKLHRVPNLHLLLVAHEQERALKGDDKAKRMVPSMGAKLSDGIGQFAHVVARFESRQVGKEYERTVQSWPTRLVDAKSRLGNLEVKMASTAWVKAVASWVEDSQAKILDPVEGNALEAENFDSGSASEESDDEDYEVADDEN